MNYKNVGMAGLISLIAFILLVNISAALDCSKCHTTEPGKSAIKAKDTIEISENTCLRCHNPEYPPTPIGYNTHLVHVGKYSAKVNFILRHPDVSKSINCGNCHSQIFDCKNCHVVGIPHIAPPLGDNCQGCHGQIDNLFRHPAINLTIHNIFHTNSTKDCTMCHNPDNMRSFELASGDIVPMEESYKLCRQCHSSFYNQWDAGSHYVNKTLPQNSGTYGEGVGADKNWEGNWRKENTCSNCHNPHNPSELYQMPAENIEKVTNVPTTSYLYVIGIIAGMAVPIFIFMKYKYGILNKLRKLSIPKISLPKISLPEISLPISISVEEAENAEKIKVDKLNIDNGVEKVAKADKKDGLIKRSEKLKSIDIKKKKLPKGDILFVLSIIISLGLSYIIFGAFLPVFTVASESMSPHIEKGDMIIYEDIRKVNDIKVYSDEKYNGYVSFGDYGDVIIYRPYGGEGIPYVHRAMYYVEKGDEMWPGGPKAPFPGYITKGDNTVTNTQYDQQIANSYLQPVKKEWIIGIAKYRIPYVGYIRMVI